MGVPNYRQARFPLQSLLKHDTWEHYTEDYGDKRIANYVKFGFPLSISRNRDKLSCQKIKNHHSAESFPEAIDDYLRTELNHGAILSPFHNVPHQQFHCSPLLTRPKDNGKRRVILDLSFPKGASVNTFVDREHFDHCRFKLKFPTIDDVTSHITSLKHPLVAKMDISRAF